MPKEPTIQELFDLTGKTALITGAGGWLGTAFSAALAEAGASVVTASREQKRADEAAARLPARGKARHVGVVLDHMDEASIQTGFKRAIELAGKIDILVNNGNEHVKHDLTDCTGEEFQRQLGNATGFFLLARNMRDHVVARRGKGSVIMIGSMYGVVGSYPDAYAGIGMASPVAYHCLKGGIVHMTRHLAVYWAKEGVRVNTLSPGPFPNEKANTEMVERLKQKCPMGRMGLPHELKGTLILLASDAGSYITGQNILIDGGWTAW